MSDRIAAIVVLYRPTRAPLLRLLPALAGDVERIYLFLNSGVSPERLAECAAAAAPTPITTLGDGTNVGLGRAYNEAAAAARMADGDLLLLFDQDSLPRPGIAHRLAAALAAAERQFGPVAAIGPLAVRPGAPNAAPADRPGLRKVPFLISSGSLIRLAALAAVGPFREDFFIDAIDIEWCFRARVHGYCCVMAHDEPMAHQLGSGTFGLPLTGLRLTQQPPARIVTFARNQAAMLRLAHVPAWWKLRVALLIALRTVLALSIGRRPAEARAILRGLRAGWRGELGPPPR